MKSLFYLISTTLLLFTGCSTDKTGIFDLYSQAGKSITMIDYATDPQYRDPVNITDARIHGDRLELTVQFSGGCKEHRFFSVWLARFLKIETGASGYFPFTQCQQ